MRKTKNQVIKNYSKNEINLLSKLTWFNYRLEDNFYDSLEKQSFPN